MGTHLASRAYTGAVAESDGVARARERGQWHRHLSTLNARARLATALAVASGAWALALHGLILLTPHAAGSRDPDEPYFRLLTVAMLPTAFVQLATGLRAGHERRTRGTWNLGTLRFLVLASVATGSLGALPVVWLAIPTYWGNFGPSPACGCGAFHAPLLAALGSALWLRTAMARLQAARPE